MKDLDFKLEDIIALIDKVSDKNISSFELEQGDFKLKLKKQTAEPTIVTAAASVEASVQVEQPVQPDLNPDTLVTAPIVGTFYQAPAPDKPPFVTVGDTVKPGDVLCIIESMKLMNEVLCEKAGTVTAVLVENAQPLEYGQPIMVIE